jgi:hypothetical protein
MELLGAAKVGDWLLAAVRDRGILAVEKRVLVGGDLERCDGGGL